MISNIAYNIKESATTHGKFFRVAGNINPLTPGVSRALHFVGNMLKLRNFST